MDMNNMENNNTQVVFFLTLVIIYYAMFVFTFVCFFYCVMTTMTNCATQTRIKHALWVFLLQKKN